MTTTQNYDDDDHPPRDSTEHHHLFFPPPSNHLQSDSYPSSTIVKYGECLKNHAASMGSYVVDGCGEFMPNGEKDNTESLRCAACGCHRNFHRKETQGKAELQHISDYYTYYSNKSNDQRHRTASPLVPSLHQQHNRLVPPMMMAFGGVPAESSGEDLQVFQSNSGGQPPVQASLSKTKRFRTKFTQEQKKRMMEYAEKLGWKIQKNDEQEVRQFCSQVGVNRQVFKVWMHNNKQRKQQQV
ncbi:zinc-finger homeodomain protein 5-like isoform X1 [Prosopis cineraria]|uniref:zinc-finger homeodomain protein 5-like isoform X1 n=1 Tax=Prosopis cineraria TaxID=364024 RepID=UPI0024101312|nr:zinc-finger homeodomain protein 5-like isoform X1 [Prosopis cineraria]XP_054810334.1 zinc-finger homeodomain protein 5-like isoform X1 [Prosopis cineraria]